MRRVDVNRVSVFNLTGSRKTLPTVEDGGDNNKRRKRKEKMDMSGGPGLELVQDLDFPDFARCLFRTADGSYFFSAGDYPPRLKCFDVSEMSQKFSFNADMPICGGVSLSSDFRRFALRSDNRQITVHNTAHVVDRLRVPHTQRCMEYHQHSTELMSGGNSSEVFRIRLDSGSFVESFKTCSEEGINAVDFFHGHGLVLTAGDNGIVEAWDPRAAPDKPAGAVNVAALDGVDGAGNDDDNDSDDASNDGKVRGGGGNGKKKGGAKTSVTCLAVDDDSSYVFCAGTSTGQVALFDIRSQRPLRVKDHMSELPIVRILFHREQQTMKNSRIISADKRTVKIWDRESGANMTAVEAPGADIFDIMVCKQQNNMVAPYRCADSGVLLIACDCPKVQTHFIPDLGRAPAWCTFLDSMAESFDEEEITTIYDDYKFVSSDEAKTLGITEGAISSGKVRPAMHGFFVELGLYRDLKAVADPGAWARKVEEKKQERRQQRVDNRISSFKRTKTDDDEEASFAPSGSSEEMKQLAKSLPADVRPLLSSMTPETLELLARDPRFSSKVGRGKFSFDAKNPEFVKLFRQIGQKRQDAAQRRSKYDQTHFKVVQPADELLRNGAEDDDSDNRLVSSRTSGGDDEDNWTRNALNETTAGGRRRARSEHDAKNGGVGRADTSAADAASKGKQRLNLATIQQREQQRPSPAARSSSGRSNSTNSASRPMTTTTMLLEAGKHTATTSSDKTMHQLRKLQRHKSKLTLEERLKRQ